MTARTPKSSARLVPVLAAALSWLAPVVATQDETKPPPEPPAAADGARLEQLLEELSDLPPAAWAQRIAAVRARIDAHRKAAAEREARIVKLREQIAAERAAAANLDREVERLQKLQGLLAPAAAAAKPEAPSAKPKPDAMTEPADARPEEAAAAKKDAASPAPPPAAAEPKPAPTAIDTSTLTTWVDHVRPLLEEHCTICHDPADTSGGLDLSTFATALDGGGSGATVVPGDAQGSRLYRLAAHLEKPVMPKGEPKLAADKLAMLAAWIDQGAPETLEQAIAFAKKRAAAAAAARKAAAGNSAKAAPERPAPLPRGWPDVDLRLVERSGPGKCLAASPTASVVALPGVEQVVVVDATTWKRLGVLEFPFGTVEVLRFSADGSRLLAAGGTAGRTGGAIVWDVVTGAELGRFGERKDAVLAAALGPDDGLIALGGTNRRVEVYAVDDGSRLFEVEHDDWVLAVDVSVDGRWLASTDRKGNVRVTEADTGREAQRLTGHTGPVLAVRFRPDGELLASAGEDGTVRAWRVRDGRQRWSQDAHRGGVQSIAWNGNGRLATGGADGRVRAWQADGKALGKPTAVGDWVFGVAVAKTTDGVGLLAADWQGRISAIDAKVGKVMRRATWTVVKP